MPTPPAISATRGRRRAAVVKPPNGPSAITRVPGRERAQAGGVVADALDRDPQPQAVRRRRERERVRLPPAVAGEEAPEEELARARARAGRAGGRRSATDTTPGASSTTRSTRRPWRRLRATGSTSRKPTIARQRGDVEAGPVGARQRLADERGAGGELVAERERDARGRRRGGRSTTSRSAAGGARSTSELTTTPTSSDEPGDRGDHAGVLLDQPAAPGRAASARRRARSRR